jgi:hypothetical protein
VSAQFSTVPVIDLVTSISKGVFMPPHVPEVETWALEKYCIYVWSAATYAPNMIIIIVISSIDKAKLLGLFLSHPIKLINIIQNTQSCCNKHIGHGFQFKTNTV